MRAQCELKEESLWNTSDEFHWEKFWLQSNPQDSYLSKNIFFILNNF